MASAPSAARTGHRSRQLRRGDAGLAITGSRAHSAMAGATNMIARQQYASYHWFMPDVAAASAQGGHEPLPGSRRRAAGGATAAARRRGR